MMKSWILQMKIVPSWIAMPTAMPTPTTRSLTMKDSPRRKIQSRHRHEAFPYVQAVNGYVKSCGVYCRISLLFHILMTLTTTIFFTLQQVQLSYAGCSRYIGLFDSKDEATTAYKLAKQCRKELDDDDPPTHRVKANLDLMRKAAFSQYSSSDNESSSSLEEEEEEEEYSSSRRRANRQERKQNNKKTSDGAPRRGPGRPLGSYKKGKPRPVKSSRGRGRPLGSTNKKKAAGTKKAADDDRTSTVSKRKPPPETTNRYAKSYARPRREAPKPPPPAPVPKSARIQKKRAAAAAPKKEAAKVQDYNLPKLKINPEILEAAKQVAESLPRGITVRPSGKWVSL